jgi:hypothetical protein
VRNGTLRDGRMSVLFSHTFYTYVHRINDMFQIQV